MACAAGTGAAVLRAAGHIFLGWGPVPDEEDCSPTDQEQEKDDRPLWLMLLPALVLLAGSCAGAAGAGRIASSAAAVLLPPGAAAGPVSSQPAPAAVLAWLSVVLALLLAAYQLSRHHLPGLIVRSVQRVTNPLSAGLDFLHSGAVGNHIAWIVVGLALFTAAFGLG